MWCYNVAGDIHNRVHVVRVAEAVPKAHQAQREATTAAGLEAVVHADPLCAQVHSQTVFNYQK